MHWHIYWGEATEDAMGAVVYTMGVLDTLLEALKRAGEKTKVEQCRDTGCRARLRRG